MATPPAKTDERPAKRSQVPLPSEAAVNAFLTGSLAWESTSKSRNSRMPMAVAFRDARNCGAGRRIRPTGRPRKIVPPATAARTSTRPADISMVANIRVVLGYLDDLSKPDLLDRGRSVGPCWADRSG